MTKSTKAAKKAVNKYMAENMALSPEERMSEFGNLIINHVNNKHSNQYESLEEFNNDSEENNERLKGIIEHLFGSDENCVRVLNLIDNFIAEHNLKLFDIEGIHICQITDKSMEYQIKSKTN